jgi:hypothetical protein
MDRRVKPGDDNEICISPMRKERMAANGPPFYS